MYVGQFSDADPDESDRFSFDFRKRLVPGETISAATFNLSVISGVDATPATRLVGVATIDGTRVNQRVASLIAGVVYKLEAIVLTSAGDTKSLWGRIECKD